MVRRPVHLFKNHVPWIQIPFSFESMVSARGWFVKISFMVASIWSGAWNSSCDQNLELMEAHKGCEWRCRSPWRHLSMPRLEHPITASHLTIFVSCLVNLCRLQSFGGSHRRAKSWYLEDSLWDLTQKETCRWLQWQAAFGIYAPGQMSLHWFNIMYIVLTICYIHIYTHVYISSTKPSEFWCQRWRSLLQDVQHGSQAGLASSAGEQRKTQLCARSTCRRLKKQSH